MSYFVISRPKLELLAKNFESTVAYDKEVACREILVVRRQNISPTRSEDYLKVLDEIARFSRCLKRNKCAELMSEVRAVEKGREKVTPRP